MTGRSYISIIVTKLFSKAKSLILFFIVLVMIVAAGSFKIWLLLVFILYAATAVYVYTFFKGSFIRWEHVYFYGALMVLCIMSYASIYQAMGVIDSTTNEIISGTTNYYYFSIVTWTTLGYGDFRPSQGARIYAASQAILGYLYMSILIAKLFHWLSEKSSKDSNGLREKDA